MITPFSLSSLVVSLSEVIARSFARFGGLGEDGGLTEKGAVSRLVTERDEQEPMPLREVHHLLVVRVEIRANEREPFARPACATADPADAPSALKWFKKRQAVRGPIERNALRTV